LTFLNAHDIVLMRITNPHYYYSIVAVRICLE